MFWLFHSSHRSLFRLQSHKQHSRYRYPNWHRWFQKRSLYLIQIKNRLVRKLSIQNCFLCSQVGMQRAHNQEPVNSLPVELSSTRSSTGHVIWSNFILLSRNLLVVLIIIKWLWWGFEGIPSTGVLSPLIHSLSITVLSASSEFTSEEDAQIWWS